MPLLFPYRQCHSRGRRRPAIASLVLPAHRFLQHVIYGRRQPLSSLLPPPFITQALQRCRRLVSQAE